jgi:IS5 family transposase
LQSRKRKGRNGNNTQDPEADYNVKIAADGKRKTTCGYKMHANTNEDGFVKKMTLFSCFCLSVSDVFL